MNRIQAELNQTELCLGLAEMATRIKGLIRNKIISNEYGEELWKLHVSNTRRAYLFAEDIGLEALETVAEFIEENPSFSKLGEAIKYDYTQQIGDGIPLIPDDNLWLEGEKPID